MGIRLVLLLIGTTVTLVDCGSLRLGFEAKDPAKLANYIVSHGIALASQAARMNSTLIAYVSQGSRPSLVKKGAGLVLRGGLGSEPGIKQVLEQNTYNAILCFGQCSLT